jgi:dTDP-4-amino-4,6-dideoxygalactose transaminase
VEALTDKKTGERTVFDGDLSAPDPIPEAGIDAAVSLMRDGRLFRYGEDRTTLPEAALLEEEFAAYMGMKFCVGVNSGGCSMFIAMRALGIGAGDKVLMNAFTLAPVPGAVEHVGAEAVLVDITDSLVIDIDDLERKAQSSGARYLLLSYMRGHIPDMDHLMDVCARHDLTVIEDCAHTMAASWDGALTGTFGAIACFSSQTFKHVNSGEGGLIVTNDEDVAARCVLLSGSYMLYEQHRARPPMEVFERHKYQMPNCSMRMSNLVAAVLRPQIGLLDQRATKWRGIYAELAGRLTGIDHIEVPVRPQKEGFVPSSLQFSLTGLTDGQIETFLAAADAHGVHVKWFGVKDPTGFTSRHDHWRYLATRSGVPRADEVLHVLCDMRLPLSMSADDCACVATVLGEAIDEAVDA